MRPVASTVRLTCHRRRRDTRLAFTLLEVLVVVAVVSLLVAVLLPALNSARESARRAACLANLTQLRTAWDLYLRDSKDRFPRYQNAAYNYGGRQGMPPSFGSKAGLPKPLNRYLVLKPVVRVGAEEFHCASDSGSSTRLPTHFCYYGTSYRTNEFLVGVPVENLVPMTDDPVTADSAFLALLKSDIQAFQASKTCQPARVAFLGDDTWWRTWLPAPMNTLPEWHRGPRSHNLAFMDGHVAPLDVRKGRYSTGDYTVLPTRRLQEAAQVIQDK
ncbi:MAG: prepilin-type N-terminal cleavage/methylation domain-containing protein [Phycisphaerae bacterium]|nr:prepilin-type N-terminal cleavage/methylation domain-containing protein [Phycisphaerae bacterium]